MSTFSSITTRNGEECETDPGNNNHSLNVFSSIGGDEDDNGEELVNKTKEKDSKSEKRQNKNNKHRKKHKKHSTSGRERESGSQTQSPIWTHKYTSMMIGEERVDEWNELFNLHKSYELNTIQEADYLICGQKLIDQLTGTK